MRKRIASLLAALLMVTGIAAAKGIPVTMFYQSARPINAYTELTRQRVLQETGVDMHLMQGGGNWKQQLSLQVTSSSAPDLIAFMDAATFQGYATTGVFYDLTDLLPNYPHIMTYLSSVQGYTAEEMLAHTTFSGRVYGLPSVTVARSYYTENIRADWLKRLKLTAPQTLAEWTEVMRAFTFGDPDGDGVDDTCGFSGSRGYNSLTPFFGAFGARPDSCYFLGKDGTVVTNVLSEQYRAALGYLRDVYAEGLIDPEMFFATDRQINEKWVDGAFGIWNSWWSGAGNALVRYNYGEKNPEDSILIIDPPTGENGQSGVIAQDPCENYFAVSAKCTHVEAVLALIDYACTTDGQRTLMWGVEGQFWTQDQNGEINWYTGIDGKDSKGNVIGDMQAYRFFYNLPIENSVLQLNKSEAGRLYRESVAHYMAVPVYSDLFQGLSTEEYVSLNDELQQYVEESGLRFIMGIADLDTDWNAYVGTYLSMGGDTVRSSLLNLYNRQHGTALTFADESQVSP